MKQMIWSSYDLLDETAKEEYQNSQREILDDDSYEVSDEEWAEEVYCRLDDERSNLNKEVDGIIVVFGNLGADGSARRDMLFPVQRYCLGGTFKYRYAI